MKLSIKSIYGLQALFELALNYGNEGIKIGAIARAQKIPPRFLEQILLQLKKKGVLESTRGIKGGYSLALPPREITLFDVVQALEGPLVFAPLKKNLKILRALNKIKGSIEAVLREKTLEDLIRIEQQSSGTFEFSI
jgi:Rrf2 family protein